jgi:SnoaL-like domain
MSTPAGDHDQLRDLLQRYSRAADARDIDTLRSLFHPDAVIDGARGVLTVEPWLDAMRAGPASQVSMHMIGVPLIEVEGDEARLDTYAVVYQVGDGSPDLPDRTLGIRYLDVAVRGDSGWQFRHRRASTVWMR